MKEPEQGSGETTVEPRGPRGKKRPPSTDSNNEQDAAIKSFSGLTSKQLEIKVLTHTQVAALIGRKPKTMEADRRKQRAAKAAGTPIDPTDPISIPYIAPTASEREVQYMASDLLAYLKRRSTSVDRSHLKRGGGYPDPAMRGFPSWLSLADASETWPFCIQADGRPLDMMEAIATDRMTEDAVRLNIREFSDMLAKAANDKQIGEEQQAYRKASRDVQVEPVDRKARWEKPGGPV